MRDLRRQLRVSAQENSILKLFILGSLLLLIGFSFLFVPAASAGYATLNWSAPTDVGITGRAAQYDLRISTQSVTGKDTLTWWNSATKVDMSGKAPGAPGTLESLVIGGLVMTSTYYAILRSADGATNWSSFSNVASFKPTLATDVPVATEVPALIVGNPRPSPSSGRTQVTFELPREAVVDANVYNALGRRVRTLEHGTFPAGSHVLHWDGKEDGGGDVASGVYWILIGAGRTQKRVKLIVAR